MIGESKIISARKIIEQLDELRKVFLRPAGRLGRIMMRAQKQLFEKELKRIRCAITAHKAELQRCLQNEMQNSIRVFNRYFG